MLPVSITIHHPRTKEVNTTIPPLWMSKRTLTEVSKLPKRTQTVSSELRPHCDRRAFLLRGSLQGAMVWRFAYFHGSRTHIWGSKHGGNPEFVNYDCPRLSEISVFAQRGPVVFVLCPSQPQAKWGTEALPSEHSFSFYPLHRPCWGVVIGGDNVGLGCPCPAPPWHGRSQDQTVRGQSREIFGKLHKVLETRCLSWLLNSTETKLKISPPPSPTVSTWPAHFSTDKVSPYSDIEWKVLIHSFHLFLSSEIKNIISFPSDLAWESRWRICKSSKGKTQHLSWSCMLYIF